MAEDLAVVDINALADGIVKTTEAVVAPLQAEVGQLRAQVAEARNNEIQKMSENEVAAFRAKHPQVDKATEAKMVALSKKYPAGQDVTPGEYMEGLLTMLEGGLGGGATTAPATKRAATEPAPPPTIALDMGIDAAIDAAFAHARATGGARPRAGGGRTGELAAARLVAEGYEHVHAPSFDDNRTRLDKAFDVAFAAARKEHLGR